MQFFSMIYEFSFLIKNDKNIAITIDQDVYASIKSSYFNASDIIWNDEVRQVRFLSKKKRKGKLKKSSKERIKKE